MKTFKTYLKEAGEARFKRMQKSMAKQTSSDPRVPETRDKNARQMELQAAMMHERAKLTAKQNDDKSSSATKRLAVAREILTNPAKYV